jgi:hypothetical protein
MCDKAAFIRGLEEISARTVPEVLEAMFFSTAAETSRESDGPEAVQTRVRFRGCPSGVFRLGTDAEAIRELAGNFLGVSPAAVGEAEVAQVACELANMLCGSVLSQAESDAGFELGAPQFGTDPEVFAADYRATFELDTGGYLSTAFQLEHATEAA